MRDKKTLIGQAIQTECIDDFNNQLKAFCQSHCVVKITYHPSIPFLAYIDYVETENIPESLHDRFAMKNEFPKCGDCPLLERPTDARRKKLHCGRTGNIRRVNDAMCEERLNEMKGDVNGLSEIKRSNERPWLDDRRRDEGVAS